MNVQYIRAVLISNTQFVSRLSREAYFIMYFTQGLYSLCLIAICAGQSFHLQLAQPQRIQVIRNGGIFDADHVNLGGSNLQRMMGNTGIFDADHVNLGGSNMQRMMGNAGIFDADHVNLGSNMRGMIGNDPGMGARASASAMASSSSSASSASSGFPHGVSLVRIVGGGPNVNFVRSPQRQIVQPQRISFPSQTIQTISVQQQMLPQMTSSVGGAVQMTDSISGAGLPFGTMIIGGGNDVPSVDYPDINRPDLPDVVYAPRSMMANVHQRKFKSIYWQINKLVRSQTSYIIHVSKQSD